jgi:outer membrane PBP1 activator LpoA protein
MEPIRDQRRRRALTLVLAAILLAACSSVPPPQEQLAAADLAVREAEEAEAGAHAAAPLRQAQDKLEQARAALQAKEHLAARRLAEQALVDAQRAEAEASAAAAGETLEEMQRSLEDLRREAVTDLPRS